jgi:hypothetical protein
VIKTTINVQVTDEDIKLGERCLSNTCPVARAISRALKSRGYSPLIYVNFTDIMLEKDYKTSYPLPVIATAFIQAYDTQREVQPFEFLLHLD